ncbi:MAG: hypothetical protein QG650_163 [Patescibacteria group bacterium]|nr:hypothetical protein [Patescibacteria group bacterium]
MLERSPELREQFTDFLERNEALYAETGRAFDFFGLEGMVSALVAEENPEREEGIVHSIRKVFGRLVARVFLRKDEVEERVSITNLLVMDRDGKKTLRIADPTLTNERSTKMEDIIFAYCCNFLNKRYMAVRFRREILRKSDTPVSLKNGK